MKKAEEIEVRHLFPELYSELIELLRKLSTEEWNCTTSNPRWNVKDITAHILDSDLRRISFQRDRLVPPQPNSSGSLLDYLNYLNASWVETSKRLSSGVLIDLIEYAGKEVQKLYASLNMHDDALFGVSWAGEEKSENWFDIAREYTEKWYHQQQIREAVGKPLLVEHKWVYPLIDTFVRGLPNIYQKVFPDNRNSIILINVGDIPDGNWILKKNDKWELFKGETKEYSSKVVMNSDTAWRMFSKNISKDEAERRIAIKGDTNLGLLILDLTAFVK